MPGAGAFVIGLAAQILHVLLLLAAAPVLIGFIRWLKARLLGRVGARPVRRWPAWPAWSAHPPP